MHIPKTSLLPLKAPSRNHNSPSSSPLLKNHISSSSSSYKHSYSDDTTNTSLIVSFPPVTPKKINIGKTMERVFPQSLKIKDYHQNEQTGLYSYENEKNITTHFASHGDLSTKDTLSGNSSSQLITLHNRDYIYKTSLISNDSLPQNHSRNVIDNKYHSHSHVMMQIMNRNLLAFFVKDQEDIILPEMYPVVNHTGEVCGLISEKIECDDYASLQKKITAKTILEEDYKQHNQNIEKKAIQTNIAVLAKIIGIDDLVYFFENPKIRNIGLTPNNKLVLFDFGVNMLDYEKENRHCLFKTDDDYDAVLLQSDNNSNSLKNTIDTYLKNYHTLQGDFEQDGTAKTVHPDIEKIIIATGPGTIEYRTKLAKLIQARINNTLLQTQKT